MKQLTNGNGRGAAANGRGSRPALTVSRRALLRSGDDQRFREMISDLITVSLHIQRVRAMLAARIGISGPQYSILLAIARMEPGEVANVRGMAAYLHVSAAFVTAEAGKLARKGLVAKSPNSTDGRSVLLSLTRTGEARLAALTPAIRAVNDRFFASLDAGDFANLARMARALARDSEHALAYLSMAARSGAGRFAPGARPDSRVYGHTQIDRRD